jgi:hypothetical protein
MLGLKYTSRLEKALDRKGAKACKARQEKYAPRAFLRALRKFP